MKTVLKRGDKVLVRNSELESWRRKYFVRIGDNGYVCFSSGDEWMSKGLTKGWKYCKKWEDQMEEGTKVEIAYEMQRAYRDKTNMFSATRILREKYPGVTLDQASLMWLSIDAYVDAGYCRREYLKQQEKFERVEKALIRIGFEDFKDSTEAAWIANEALKED